ncbi:hypothetical protein EDB87DRAFT_1577762 [Lactarius vividus]|nr:hypothetical protein EDB87DRAFT_1577762 [Lactarius vividus]
MEPSQALLSFGPTVIALCAGSPRSQLIVPHHATDATTVGVERARARVCGARSAFAAVLRNSLLDAPPRSAVPLENFPCRLERCRNHRALNVSPRLLSGATPGPFGWVNTLSCDFAPTLLDRGMRTQSLTAFVFFRQWANLMCRYGLFLLVPHGKNV